MKLLGSIFEDEDEDEDEPLRPGIQDVFEDEDEEEPLSPGITATKERGRKLPWRIWTRL